MTDAAGNIGSEEPHEAVAAHFQKDRGQDDGAGRGRLNVRVGKPGVDRPHRQLHGEGGQECEPEPGLQVLGEVELQKHRDLGRARLPVHGEDRQQHEQRAEQRIEKELEARIDAPLAAPDADDEEHRDQAALEEQIEEHEVERAEHADHQRFQQQERDHVFLHARLDRVPAREDTDRHQEGREDDEGQRKPVDAHVIGDGVAEPGMVLDELEAAVRRVEPGHQHERDAERYQRGPQRNPARISLRRFVAALSEIMRRKAPTRGKRMIVVRIGQSFIA